MGPSLRNRRGFPELKFTDTTFTTTAINTTWSLTLLNGVAQGTDYNQRIGRQTSMKSLLINANIYNSQASSQPQGACVRLVIIYDSQPNGAAPIGTDVFAAGTSTCSPMNLNNRDRFKVLMDERCQIGAWTITAGALSAGAPQNVFVTRYRKINLDCIFNGTGATVAAINTGALFLCYVADVANSIFDFYTRVRYNDN